MPISKPIETVQKELQELLVDDIVAAIKALQGLLPSTSETYNTLVGLLARLNEANKARLRKTLSNDELQIEYNQIRAAFLEIVQELKEDDFKAEASVQPDQKGGAAPRQGNILYRIPGLMPKEKESKCVVRIALSEDAIVEDIEIDEHVQMKELYRVSDTMQAELIDPSGGKKFQITTISDDIQIIDEEGFTEWWFYVTPIEEGKFPLVLKVSIIEMIDGQPRNKEIIMEEIVEVITEGEVMDTESAKPKQAGAISIHTAATAAAGLVTGVKASKTAKFSETAKSVEPARSIEPAPQQVPQAAPAAPAPTTEAARSVLGQLGLVQKVIIGLAIAGVASVATWIFTPEPTKHWWKARYVDDTVAAYTAFMDEHPTSPNYETAACRKATLLNTPQAFRNYLYEFPNGICKPEAEQALVRLEQEALDELEQNPGMEALNSFLINFPECSNLETLYNVVKDNERLRSEFLPLILQRWEECKRQDSGFPDIPLSVISELPSIDTGSLTGQNSTEVAPAESVNSVNNNTGEQTSTPADKQPENPQTSSSAPKMIFVQGGTFQMGLDNNFVDDTRHEVSLRDFFIGQFEVTFNEYDRFCEATGREKPEDNGWGRGSRPVIKVSWTDAVEYCNWLSRTLGLREAYTITGGTQVSLNPNANGFRLPTEAEWEYAAKGGYKEQDYQYSGSQNVNEVAWYQDNSGNHTHPVGHLKPNDLNIYDMSGNVREWCYDAHGPYPSTAVIDPVGPAFNGRRIFRGGFWGRNPQQMLVTYRNSWKPDFKHYGTGFRLARWK